MKLLFLCLLVVSFFSFNTLKSSEINIHVHTHAHNQSSLHKHEHIHSDTSYVEYLNTKLNHQKKFEYKSNFYVIKEKISNQILEKIFRPPIV